MTQYTKQCLRAENDARTGMPSRMPGGAICVQRFDDSRNSAIHITYHISLRSSSIPEPRDPLLKVFQNSFVQKFTQTGLKFQERFDGLQRALAQGGFPAATRALGPSGPAKATWLQLNTGGRLGPFRDPHSVMILPQVHLRKPCYDFYFL